MAIQLSDHFSYRKLIRFTLPSIAMMIFTSIYGIVDGLFVSNFSGKEAFAAVNLCWPVLMIFGTVGFMFGTGGTALVALTLGEGEKKRANEYFSLIVYVAFGAGVVLAILGIAFFRPIALLLGADEELLPSCLTYSRIFLSTLPFYVLQVMFQSFFVAAEKPNLGFWVTLAAGFTNIIGDALLVTLLPQQWKLTGAAIASAGASFMGGAIPLVYFFRHNTSLLRLGKTHFTPWVLWRASSNGFSEFMTNISMSVVGVLFNVQLMKYAGANGVAAYGVMMYVSMIFTAIFVGYIVGAAPVISYHLGARNHSELRSLLVKSLIIIVVTGLFMVLFGEVLAAPLSSIFVGYDEELLNLTVQGFRIFALSFGFIGFGIFASGFFTALNDGVTSALISFLRTLVFESGAVLLLPRLFGISGIWYAVVVSEFMSLILGGIFLVTKQKKFHY